MAADADIGVIGGSGLYELLEGADEVSVRTPYGAPSATLTVGRMAGRKVAFLPRHGLRHELPPHRIPYRANLWALRELGVTRVVSPCAAGSLRRDIHPGEMVVVDQLIDRTWGRPDTYFDGGVVNHITFADPYCPELRSTLLESSGGAGVTVHDGGTMVVIQGPRFSTRAESAWYRSAGWHVINMTGYPEAALARELGLCFSAIALITDYDTGVEGVENIEAVTMNSVFAVLEATVADVRRLLTAALPDIPAHRTCGCAAGATGGPIEQR